LPCTLDARPSPAPPTAAVAVRYDTNNHTIDAPGDPSRRAFTYFILTGGRIVYASALRLAARAYTPPLSTST